MNETSPSLHPIPSRVLYLALLIAAVAAAALLAWTIQELRKRRSSSP